MFYHLLAPLGKHHIFFNLFNYISFRAAGATVTAILLAFLVGPAIIARLRARKIGQVIRAEGPASHQGKRGTPTMGGVIILLATVVPTLLWAPLNNRFVLFALLATLWMGGIGFLDDYLKIVEGKSRGLVAKWKLVGQVSFGLVLGTLLLFFPVIPPDTIPASATTLPFFKFVIVVFAPWVYVTFVTFVITGSSNAVNLTDGLDGLATGLSAIAAGGFALFAYLLGRVDATGYLNLFYLPGAGELTIFCAALLGGCLGFLWFNAHPAQVFMGDTGSLALGGAFGTVSILLKSEFLLLVIGGVFVAEAVSVILQTGVYRWYKRSRGKEYADQHRVFRMAPLHHHFEKLGWHESTVVTRFYILGIFCAMVALATLKLR
ncbi:MAG: phospho-N-acetylmuramoyl-pentapeptide-transferase [Gemmatimonadetes bacterium]|nr:phospho-N-acetylmuramoyl-pentapeptide-transferase [Gemmatimonadota bacterium]MBP6669426.1 phospho-N-acetylmuramoyl-pentapeptide-transferase [Gemmatimonadales bacterium]MBK6778776.1 phospho-N-acetylmuramoyl-pentapeptide-transferase [Gemmatimonadota bacterium]MBK7348913.1 phospho-N-acetylmuramoyl-pentapeptide-transferase [Gemmatimonadota bacterium]MBK7714476.1 phospho-N-acetylmuramoyl-pentapeptide-transferase [Gemmatimonadota bacterium]